MNAAVELNLALILFLPWYAILAAVYWWYPRAPRTLARWSFDASAVATTTLLSVASMHWSYGYADPSAGAIWKQVLATSVSYGVFLAALTAAYFLRRALLVRPRLARAEPYPETTP